MEIVGGSYPVESEEPALPEVGPPGGELGKDEFLKLLVTQMQNQDPLEPMDSQSTIAQLAQFSSLEQMSNLNEAFGAFRKEGGMVQALLLEGREVELQLEDGTFASGPIEKVLWEAGAMTLQIGGITYPITNVLSISSLSEIIDEESGEEVPVEEE